MALALALTAALLSVVELARTRGLSLPGWAILTLALAHLWPIAALF